MSIHIESGLRRVEMAFEPNNIKITNSIKNQNNITKEKTEELNIPSFVDDVEKTKNYTFSLQPSVRKKLNLIAKEQGYPSASRFFNDLIKNMK